MMEFRKQAIYRHQFCVIDFSKFWRFISQVTHKVMIQEQYIMNTLMKDERFVHHLDHELSQQSRFRFLFSHVFKHLKTKSLSSLNQLLLFDSFFLNSFSFILLMIHLADDHEHLRG